MINTEIKSADTFVTLIPERMRDEGPVLMAFIKAYYEWLDESGLGRPAELLELRDIDETVDEFTQFFKETYLPDIPNLSPDRIRLLVKNINSFYNTRGSEESFKLLFKLLYGVESSVYAPGKDVLIASDGKWFKPRYIEVTDTPSVYNLVGRSVFGSLSGASATVENTVRKNMNGAFFNVVYITNVRGNFIAGDIISADGILEGAPTVLGSLNHVDVIEGGQGNQVGDVFEVQSSIGRYGKVRVTEIENGTGRVDFDLVDGGTGYSLNADTIISDKVYTVINAGNFQSKEVVYQPKSRLYLLSQTGTWSLGDLVVGKSTGGALQGTGTITAINTDLDYIDVVHSDLFTEFGFADYVETVDQSTTALIDTFEDLTIKSKVVGQDSLRIGVYDSSGNFSIDHKIFGQSSQAVATIVGMGQGSGATFGIGSLTNEETVWLNTDMVGGLNVNGVPYLSIRLDGSGSGTGFVDSVDVIDGGSGYIDGEAVQFLNGGDQISALNIISPGTGYANGERIEIASGSGTGFKGTVITDGSGAIASINISKPGQGYYDDLTVMVSSTAGSGANLQPVTTISTPAEATAIVSAGAITGLNITSVGGGYFSAPTIYVPGGSGADIVAEMDYGYGFPRLPQGDIESIIDECLTTGSVTIGTIATLNNISPGQGYNQNPFVLVIEPLTYSAGRKNIILHLTSIQSAFMEGEIVYQTTSEMAQELVLTNITGVFGVGDYITQGTVSGVVYYRDATTIRVNQREGGDFTNGPIQGSSGATADVSSSSIAPYETVAKGIVKSFDGNNLTITRMTFNTSFSGTSPIIGLTTGAKGVIVTSSQDDNSLPMGGNADIDATVKTATGIATKVQVIDSGFGYVDDDVVVMVNEENPFSIKGLTTVSSQGESEGYWRNTDGFLNSDKYLQDGDYYQAFSYEVQVGVSIDRYADIVKKLLHTAGTKMFGRYVMVATDSIDIKTHLELIQE